MRVCIWGNVGILNRIFSISSWHLIVLNIIFSISVTQDTDNLRQNENQTRSIYNILIFNNGTVKVVRCRGSSTWTDHTGLKCRNVIFEYVVFDGGQSLY